MSRVSAQRAVEKRVLTLLHGRKTRTQLTQIHAHFLRHNLHQSNLLLSHFVSVCASLDRTSYAQLVFDQIRNPNIHLFNSMIKAYSNSETSQESLRLFSLMRYRDIWPDEFTFPPLIKACSNLLAVDLGRGLHAQLSRLGLEALGSVQIGLVELYAYCDRMDDARLVFGSMTQRDIVVWNLMICGFCQRGNIESGFGLFRQMGERNVVSWNSMIAGLAQSGRDGEALDLFREMQEAGFEPDDATLVTVLPACARLGAIDLGRWIHSYVDSRGFLKIISVGNSLVDMYSKCGDLDSARNVFDKMPQRNAVSWNAMISGLAFNGKGDLGLEMFEEMKREDFEPNWVTYIGVLSCCTHAGLVQKGRELFDSMIKDRQIEPRLEHYGCMVDLLGRYGHVKEAYGLIRGMHMKANAAVLGALLSACRIHGDVDVAEFAAKELIDLEPWNSGNYVLLSSIYADAGRWNDAEKMRTLMKEKNVRKEPGCSAVNVNSLTRCLDNNYRSVKRHGNVL